MKYQSIIYVDVSLICLHSSASKPADYVQASLATLSGAARSLGAHRTQAVPEALSEVLQQYEQRVATEVIPAFLESLEKQQSSDLSVLVRQLQTDVAYLKQVLPGSSSDGSTGWSKLDTRLSKVKNVSSLEINAECHSQLMKSGDRDDEAGRQAFLRTQSLLAPLMMSGFSSLAADNKGSVLLPFGAPMPISASDTKLFLAKPGPRFALLQVSQTAA